ncbi:MAG: sugar phosphate isomerase/epimerase [Actinomycetia bacterium]|nr:sugar phosphate isomerase/epimerase [Actinomycetes bacterium]
MRPDSISGAEAEPCPATGGAPIKVGLSTASVYPESTAVAFEIAARLGYDGVEVMVGTDPDSQNPAAWRQLADQHGVPVLAVHAPCLFVTGRVWSTDPEAKLRRAYAAAEALGAPVVVAHPPFVWQREHARRFPVLLAELAEQTAVRFAVENMYPARQRGQRLGGPAGWLSDRVPGRLPLRWPDVEMSVYRPSWDVAETGYRDYTLDLSHTAASRSDALAMMTAMGDRLAHMHLADGVGTGGDEHLVPGRGNQPCAQALARLPRQGFSGAVIVEVSTRRAIGRAAREADLAEALAFCRRGLSEID